ncbi:MAG TPA: UDP-N-acetylmuramate dehydrogenase [Bacteroidota bacterium]|nr:UDP-N-acetylmuramate dehydrogenase [Bacteroidota bacterium]
MVSVEDIRKVFRGHVAVAEPLAKYTSFRIGGPADFYLEPVDKFDLIEVVRFFKKFEYRFMIIGKGSNLLISDAGFRGAAINLEEGMGNVSIDRDLIVADSGVRLSKFVDFCIQHEKGGVEMLAGIPGTIGGAVIMNAGAYGGEISDHLVDIEIYRDDTIQKVKKDSAGFSYRRSGFTRDVVLNASFLLPQGDLAELLRRRRELLLKRNQSQPLNLPNSGSMFKNPSGTFAAKLVEEAGLKGKRIGGAQISERHGNFIVNHGHAKAQDVLDLVKLARKEVFEKSGITLELEVKLIGFREQEVVEVAD